MTTVDFEAYLNHEYDGDKPFDLSTLFAMEDEAGIDVVVVMPANQTAGKLNVQPDNQRVADAIAAAPDGARRCVGCATINPTLGEDNVRRQFEIVDRHAFRGTKLMATLHKYNVDEPVVDSIMRLTRDRGLVASIHSGPNEVHPNRIGNLSKRFPDVPIIMDHMGYPDATDEAIRVAEECPNVYLGATILRFFKPPEQANPTAIADAVRRVGPDRVVFGSNAPEYPHSPLWCRQAIERLKLGQEAEAMIFGGTLARLYKLS